MTPVMQLIHIVLHNNHMLLTFILITCSWYSRQRNQSRNRYSSSSPNSKWEQTQRAIGELLYFRRSGLSIFGTTACSFRGTGAVLFVIRRFICETCLGSKVYNPARQGSNHRAIRDRMLIQQPIKLNGFRIYIVAWEFIISMDYYCIRDQCYNIFSA